mmetsp:Transcript_31024/g.72096  ORF Transcript_31024/g.72096 Transcript_31024/m.72096 type:complete len:231 (-) Transcript_31024:2330-3022(-)
MSPTLSCAHSVLGSSGPIFTSWFSSKQRPLGEICALERRSITSTRVAPPSSFAVCFLSMAVCRALSTARSLFTLAFSMRSSSAASRSAITLRMDSTLSIIMRRKRKTERRNLSCSSACSAIFLRFSKHIARAFSDMKILVLPTPYSLLSTPNSSSIRDTPSCTGSSASSPLLAEHAEKYLKKPTSGRRCPKVALRTCANSSSPEYDNCRSTNSLSQRPAACWWFGLMQRM